MKVKAPSLMKKIIEALSSKTNELRIRMMIFFLLHKNLDKSSLTTSLQSLVSSHHHHHNKKKNDDAIEDEEEESKGSLLMNYNKGTNMDVIVSNTHDNMNNVVGENLSRDHHQYYYNDDVVVEDEEEDDEEEEEEEDGGGVKHPRVDLTNTLFEESKEEMEKERESQEVVVAEGEGEGEGEEEEDIDLAADMFIERFKKQMLLQKQRSLERQQWLAVDV